MGLLPLVAADGKWLIRWHTYTIASAQNLLPNPVLDNINQTFSNIV